MDRRAKIEAEVQKVVQEFTVRDSLLNTIVDAFVEQATASLAHDSSRGLPMIPTYVTKVPSGKEEGLYLAADLGGSNFRVCSVQLDGNSHYQTQEDKWKVPAGLQQSTSREFFDFLATCVGKFIEKYHGSQFATESKTDNSLKMGFTFSFPVEQTSLNSGTLIRWTKGFDIKDAVGKDICKEFQHSLDSKNIKVHVAALINDTVGALMARSYTKNGEAQTMIGAIIGTGTNAAYTEKISHIEKFSLARHPEVDSNIMAINTEWGSFDNDLTVLPVTKYDVTVNKETPNPDFHMFEKRVSGMYLGELLRLVLVELHADGVLFTDYQYSQLKPTWSQPWSTDTSVPAIADGDDTSDLVKTGELLREHYGFVNTSYEERKAVKDISHAIGKRAAYLSAAALGGLLKLTKGLEKFDSVDIGGDGTVFERYPKFEEHLRQALRKTFIGENEKRITFGLAKDGSGVGAALCAAITD